MKLSIRKGQRFGKLFVIREVEPFKQPSGQTQRGFLCKCDCGKEKVIRLSALIRLRTTSCGCQSKIWNGESTTRLWKTWKAMKERVHLSSFIHVHRYKERGITIDKEWDENYFAFKDWALKNGYTDNLQMDRIDNNGNYEPSNCRFVTNMENANNREVTFFVNYKDRSIPIMQLFRELNIPEQNYAAIRTRIKRGWNHTEAFDKPIKNGNYKKKTNNITQIT